MYDALKEDIATLNVYFSYDTSIGNCDGYEMKIKRVFHINFEIISLSLNNQNIKVML